MKLGTFSISLAVKDIEASKAFYEKFGFAVFGGNADENWLILRNGSATIGLFQGMFERNIMTFNPGWNRAGETLEEFTDVRELQRQLKRQGLKPEPEADVRRRLVLLVARRLPDRHRVGRLHEKPLPMVRPCRRCGHRDGPHFLRPRLGLPDLPPVLRPVRSLAPRLVGGLEISRVRRHHPRGRRPLARMGRGRHGSRGAAVRCGRSPRILGAAARALTPSQRRLDRPLRGGARPMSARPRLPVSVTSRRSSSS